jgi:hypothetical protein
MMKVGPSIHHKNKTKKQNKTYKNIFPPDGSSSTIKKKKKTYKEPMEVKNKKTILL